MKSVTHEVNAEGNVTRISAPTGQIIPKENFDIEAVQTQALQKIGDSLAAIGAFLTTGGLAELLSGYARTQAVKDILGGLAAHDGRNALDARTIKQNALEISEAIEAVFTKYSERLKEKGRDPEIHDAEKDMKERS